MALENVGFDGLAHRPGWSAEVLQFLVEKRNIAAIGHETPDTDSGRSVSEGSGFPLEKDFLNTGRWQIELLANLWASARLIGRDFADWPKPRGGTGFPVRAIALFAAGLAHGGGATEK